MGISIVCMSTCPRDHCIRKSIHVSGRVFSWHVCVCCSRAAFQFQIFLNLRGCVVLSDMLWFILTLVAMFYMCVCVCVRACMRACMHMCEWVSYLATRPGLLILSAVEITAVEKHVLCKSVHVTNVCSCVYWAPQVSDVICQHGWWMLFVVYVVLSGVGLCLCFLFSGNSISTPLSCWPETLHIPLPLICVSMHNCVDGWGNFGSNCQVFGIIHIAHTCTMYSFVTVYVLHVLCIYIVCVLIHVVSCTYYMH